MLAYPDSVCIWGYKTVCTKCFPNAQKDPAYHFVDFNNPLSEPPALGKKQPCEICGKKYELESSPTGQGQPDPQPT